jgi:dTMP kinase|tara:strand:+ start:430 stop:1047 length:618 start_codon:yes stop_codon:yes gene_type:complete
MYKYPIIVFEGIEGSGKTLHVNHVSKYLKRKKIKFIRLREPGGNISSEKIRKLILSNKSNFHKITDLLLYLAARNENLEQTIKKNYGKKLILIDRFIDSTLAYQHYGMGIDYKFINLLNNFLIKNIKITVTFLNLVNAKNLRIRLSKRKNLNRYDKLKFKLYKKIQKGYIKISKKKKNKYVIIDSNKPILINKKIITEEIDKFIK